MAQHNKHSSNSLAANSWEYLRVPVKTFISLFPGLTGRYEGLAQYYLDDQEEEVMLGYESSLAGIYNNTDNNTR